MTVFEYISNLNTALVPLTVANKEEHGLLNQKHHSPPALLSVSSLLVKLTSVKGGGTCPPFCNKWSYDALYILFPQRQLWIIIRPSITVNK